MTDSELHPTSEPLVLVPLPGSERPAAEGIAPAAVSIDHDSAIEVTIILRRRASMSTDDALGTPLSSEEVAARFGADPADAALVGVTLTALGLRVLSTDLAPRRVRVSGTVANIGRVFGTSVSAGTAQAGTATHRIRTGGLSIPAQLDGIITAVLGIDDRPQARAQFRVSAASAASVSYTPVQLGELYKFPAGTDGTGQTIAIIELGGGYETADLKTYFSGLGVGSPSVASVGVDGAKNEPGKDPTGADGEVLLDIEVIGALSPAAKILVYFAPNTDAGFVDAVSDAAHATPAPTAMSISWGQSEDQWTAQARTALDDALLDAAALGVTVTAAAGDNGSTDGSDDGAQHADFPASSPHALACGGTSLHAKGTAIATETVWNDGANGGATGGGVSDVFALPTWQKGVGVPAAKKPGGRGVPDVAGNADPETGYQVLVDGTRAVYGGTSAVAPLWAALVARLAQSLGSPLGLLQPKLYPLHAALHDITSGNNGSFEAKKGWDACTGLGTPNGTAILAALKAASQ
ncbi:MAG TPA: S53 family peptidase [Galbitalea sp.]|jgi:kumamolisin|nr:S53 family peptidase [Galbitalea sp.]